MPICNIAALKGYVVIAHGNMVAVMVRSAPKDQPTNETYKQRILSERRCGRPWLRTEQQEAGREDHHFPRLFLIRALENSDQRIADDKSVTPYFLLSAFLWEAVQNLSVKKQQEGENKFFALQQAANEVLSEQIKTTAIPRRITQSMRDVWTLQSRFEQRSPGKVYRLLNHPRFRAAYDFLVLRAETGGASEELAQWWTVFQEVDDKERETMLKAINKGARKYRRHTRRSDNHHNE